ncbi:hypothetical protein ACFEMC_07030 [Kineococcus sp. DHX-1]
MGAEQDHEGVEAEAVALDDETAVATVLVVAVDRVGHDGVDGVG